MNESGQATGVFSWSFSSICVSSWIGVCEIGLDLNTPISPKAAVLSLNLQTSQFYFSLSLNSRLRSFLVDFFSSFTSHESSGDSQEPEADTLSYHTALYQKRLNSFIF